MRAVGHKESKDNNRRKTRKNNNGQRYINKRGGVKGPTKWLTPRSTLGDAFSDLRSRSRCWTLILSLLRPPPPHSSKKFASKSCIHSLSYPFPPNQSNADTVACNSPQNPSQRVHNQLLCKYKNKIIKKEKTPMCPVKVFGLWGLVCGSVYIWRVADMLLYQESAL